MKKIIISQGTAAAALELLRADNPHTEHAAERTLDRKEAEIKKAWSGLFEELKTGSIDFFYYWQPTRKGANGQNIIIYTRSVKTPGSIQRSIFWKRNGEYIALSDQQYISIEDAERRGGIKDNVTIFAGSNQTREARTA